MSAAEVMTTAITAALYHVGNFDLARKFLKAEGYIPNMLGKSRFNRRLHRIRDLFLTLLHLLGVPPQRSALFYQEETAHLSLRSPFFGLKQSPRRMRGCFVGQRAPSSQRQSSFLRETWKELNSQSIYRKIFETAGGLIERVLPKTIHSVTVSGFLAKSCIVCPGL